MMNINSIFIENTQFSSRFHGPLLCRIYWFQIKACLTHWGRDKMDATSQTTFSSAFSWKKMCKFRLIFHWSLFPIDNIPVLVQTMAWRRPGDKPLSEPMVASVCDVYMRCSASKSSCKFYMVYKTTLQTSTCLTGRLTFPGPPGK